jgi:fructan beta-fructosidase
MHLIKSILYALFCTLFITCDSIDNKNIEPKTYEAHRPLYHFTPDSMWMNDPNGMVYYEGEYHLFYQYYPKDIIWGPMHWAHAVSTDMIDWKDLSIALYPDSLGLIFSGSAVIDWNNTSGFGINGQPPMVAIFTHHNMDGEKSGKVNFQNQSIAYSNDKGRTWKKYKDNPVIKNPGIKDFRDPKVMWHEATQKWILVLAARDKVKFYQSSDLKSWTYASDFGISNDTRLWECPDLFPIKVEGSNEEKWILITSMQSGAPNGGTGSSYWVGDFDGKIFKCNDAIANQKWLDSGKDNYAFVTWSDVPKSDGRRLGIGWMSNWQYAQKVPSENWRSAMTLPRELTLYNDNGIYSLRSNPVRELENYAFDSKPIHMVPSKDWTVIMDGHSTAHLSLSFQKPVKGKLVIRFSNSKGEYSDVGFDAGSKKYFIDRSRSGITDFNPDFTGNHVANNNYDHSNLDIEIYLDHSSIELFADGGRCVMTETFFSHEPYTKVEVINADEEVKLIVGSVSGVYAIGKRK